MQSMARLAVPPDGEGRSVLTDHGLGRSHYEVRGANDRRSFAAQTAVPPGGSARDRDGLERVAWLALMPVYVALAVVVTAAYAVAALVVHARS
jgi:hypothetical protein